MKPTGDIEIFGIVDIEQPMAQGEIEKHQVDVELEIIGRTDPLV